MTTSRIFLCAPCISDATNNSAVIVKLPRQEPVLFECPCSYFDQEENVWIHGQTLTYRNNGIITWEPILSGRPDIKLPWMKARKIKMGEIIFEKKFTTTTTWPENGCTDKIVTIPRNHHADIVIYFHRIHDIVGLMEKIKENEKHIDGEILLFSPKSDQHYDRIKAMVDAQKNGNQVEAPPEAE